MAKLRSASCRFEFSTNSLRVKEQNAPITLDLRRTGDLNLTGTVEYVTVEASARANQDFVAVTNVVNFSVGEEQKPVTLELQDDQAAEGKEEFVVTLRRPQPMGTALGSVSSCRIVIQDDDSWIGFAQTNLFASEGSGLLSVPVVREGDTSKAATLNVSTEGLTAAADIDFEPAATSIVLGVGETEKTFTISIKPDSLLEPDEHFVVRMSDPKGSVVPYLSQAVVTLLDDDRPGTIDSSLVGVNGPGLLRRLDHLQLCPGGGFLLSGVFELTNSIEQTFLCRYRSDGAIDESFVPVAVLPTPTPDPDLHRAGTTFSQDVDGRIYLSGWLGPGPGSVNGVACTNLVRLKPNGTCDPSFNAFTDGETLSIPQRDGKVLISGNFHHVNGRWQPYLAILNADGSLNPMFKPRPNPDTIGMGTCAVQADGKILVTGVFWGFEGLSRNYLARLNPDGSLDRGFAGIVNGTVLSIRTLPGQRILIAGGFTTPRRGIAILLSDGRTDPTFDPKDTLNGLIFQAVPLADGRIMVAGLFTGAGPNKQNYLIRLNPNGSVDPTFDTGAGPNDFVWIVALEPTGPILAGGGFTMCNRQPANHLTRLHSDGTRPTFGTIELLPNGACSLQLFGNAGRKYNIESSSDLSNWSLLRSEIFAGTSFQWTEPHNTMTVLFYRASEVK